jgi:DNA-binding NarL/FixJ family response regulator
MTIRLVLADEQPVYRLGLESLLAANPGFEITANCADGEATLRAVEEQRPDILMVDLHLPRLDTLDLLRKIRGAGIPLPVVVLTAALNEDDLLAMMPLGVRGVVLKTMPVEHIIRCLFKVQGGDTWLEMHSVSLALDKLQEQSSLTERRWTSAAVSTPGPGSSVARPTWMPSPCQRTRNCSRDSASSRGAGGQATKRARKAAR